MDRRQNSIVLRESIDAFSLQHDIEMLLVHDAAVEQLSDDLFLQTSLPQKSYEESSEENNELNEGDRVLSLVFSEFEE